MKQQTKGGALHKVWQALPWLWMAAAYLFDLWYQLVPGKWIVDSDLASEMILSDLLNKEGTITVSYTHLDVYKRQILNQSPSSCVSESICSQCRLTILLHLPMLL